MDELVPSVYTTGTKEVDSYEQNINATAGNGDEKNIVLESLFYMLTGYIDNFTNLVNVNLQVFIVIGQPIVSLNGIEQLKRLTELWVCECFLEDASSVSGCPELKKLHLYSNKLTTTPNLSELTKLTILSLATNQISQISPSLPESLKELNLADNSIADLRQLASCKNLEILNLTGNNIRTFSTIAPILKLSKIRSLYFIDNVYRRTFITSLVNYRSYVILNMEHLRNLDGRSIEAEERINVMNFYSQKFRFYQVLYNRLVNSFYDEDQKLTTQSYNQLNALRSAMFNANIKIHKFKETSSVGKDCREKMKKYDISLYYWECRHRNWYPRIEREFFEKRSFLELEITQYGNVNFLPCSNLTHIVNTVSNIMQNFICPYAKRNSNLTSIQIDQVVQLINAHHRGFDRFRGVQEVVGVGIMDSHFFIINSPCSVNDSTKRLFPFIKDYITLKEHNAMKCLVTNSISIADAEWLENNFDSRNDLIEEQLQKKRVLMLGYVISDELMGSFTKETTAKMHLKSNSEPTEHCFHCATYTSIIPENIVPALIVEYRYVYKDNSSSLSDQFSIPECERLATKLVSACKKFNTTSWQSLTCLNLSKSQLSCFEIVTVFENVTELDISYNQISTLQEVAKLFPKLQDLNAMFNDITVANMGRDMKALECLNLKFNKLTSLILNLYWLKKYCKALEKLDVGLNPIVDVHNPIHLSHITLKYFPNCRRVNDEWLDDSRDNMIYKLRMKELPSVVLPNSAFLKTKPLHDIQANGIDWNGIQCLRDNGSPISHYALNKQREVVCVYIINGNLFQSIVIDIKIKSTVKWLTIKNNLLSTISFIIECPKIEELDFSYNILQSSDITPISKGLKHLVKLNLMCNYLKDLEGFVKADLPHLRVLNLSYNSIRKLDGIKHLKSLEELYVAGNKIKKWEHMQFINSWKFLKVIDLTNNDIEDKEMLRTFLIYHGLHLEYINGTPVTEEQIADANDTLSGTLNKHFLIKIYKPNQIKLLTELTVKKCGIRKTNMRDPDFLNLTSVNLENNLLTTFGSLSYLKHLKTLCLASNRIATFGEVKRNFEALEILYLNSNNISDLVPLELGKCPKLSALYLQDNDLTALEGINELKRLQYLVVDRNKLSTVKPEEMQLKLLKELYLEFNSLKHLGFLNNLKNLKKLYMAHNKIHEQSTLGLLGGLKRLNDLTILGNPVCRNTSHYSFILNLLPKLLTLDGHGLEAKTPSLPVIS